MLLVVARAVMSSGRALSAVLLPIYLSLIGFSASELGLIIALVAVTSAVMTSAVGLLSDRLGRKFFVIAVPLLAALAAIACAAATALIPARRAASAPAALTLGP